MPKKSSVSDIKLNSIDNLFGMTDSTDSVSDVREISLDELYEFNGHPFKVRDDDKMQELTDSIKEHGVLVPGIARLRPKGGYKIIAGHSRKQACINAGITTMPMFIKNLSDDEATIVMVDSNIQREDILPSEKARAYKMKYDAIKHQGVKGNSLITVGEEAGESAKTVQRYVWLARLNDELLEMVDSRQISIVQGVDISFLTDTEQSWVLNAFDRFGVNITTSQSAELKAKSQAGELDETVVWSILAPVVDKKKPRRVTFKAKKLDEYFADSYSEEQIEEIIIGLLDKWKQEERI